jgi:chaperone modulatory protein CbpM
MQPNFTITTPLHAVSFVMEDIVELTLDDLCRGCSAQADSIIELVSEGVIDSTSLQTNQPPEQWRFTGFHLHRAKVAMRLHRDLGVNFAGVALALQLLDEIRALKENHP